MGYSSLHLHQITSPKTDRLAYWSSTSTSTVSFVGPRSFSYLPCLGKSWSHEFCRIVEKKSALPHPPTSAELSPRDHKNVVLSAHLDIRNSKSVRFLYTAIALTWAIALMMPISLNRSFIPVLTNICPAHLSQAWCFGALQSNFIIQREFFSLDMHS